MTTIHFALMANLITLVNAKANLLDGFAQVSVFKFESKISFFILNRFQSLARQLYALIMENVRTMKININVLVNLDTLVTDVKSV